MFRALRLIFFALLGLGLTFRVISAELAAPSGSVAPAYVPGRLLVKFKAATFGPARGPQTSYQLPSAAQTALAKVNGRVDRAYAGIGWVRVLTDRPVPEAVAALQASGAVDYAEPDWIVHAYATPNDPGFSRQWGLHNTGQDGGTADADIDAPEAWETRTAAGGVIVGVVDSGVDYNHPDLKANMWVNPGEIPGNGIDDDHNGYVDDIHGINAIANSGNPMDNNGHGTHVAGTIGARGDNGRGVTGVAWRTQLMALKFLGAQGNGATSDAIETLHYAIAVKQANGYPRLILNNSWGGGPYEQALYDAIAQARDAGILFVAAAGNNGVWIDYQPEYPAAYDLANIVSVGATDRDDQPAAFSNRGCYSVDLFAPGKDILSTWWGKCPKPDGPIKPYCTISGTSMATPHVAGAAAVIWGQYPARDWKAVKRALLAGADRNPNLGEMSVSQARLNLRRALLAGGMNRPSVWGLRPMDPAPGDQIVLTGSRFGATAGSLDIDGSALRVDEWSDERILATLPESMKTGYGRLRLGNAQGLLNGNGVCIQVGNQLGATTRVNVDSAGGEANAAAYYPDLSANGRYVVFHSQADNLVGGDLNQLSDIFLHDRFTAETRRISQGMLGEEANGLSIYPSISADGRYVVYVSQATNLVPGDGNGLPDIFLFDRVNDATVRVNQGPNGEEANDISTYPVLSADGRYVAYGSEASNLVPGVGNGAQHIYRHDRLTGQTVLASASSAGVEANASSGVPSLSSGGGYVTFASSATNLVPADASGFADIYLREFASSRTFLLSRNGAGQAGNNSSSWPSISGNAERVVFMSAAGNLVPDDQNGFIDIFLSAWPASAANPTTSRLSLAPAGEEANGHSNGWPRISADGRFVAFYSAADNLVSGDHNGIGDIFVRDLTTGSTSRANLSDSGGEANGGSFFMVNRHGMSADGRFVAFYSAADNLVAADANKLPDIFVRDRELLPGAGANLTLTTPADVLICPPGPPCVVALHIENRGPGETPARLIQVLPSGVELQQVKADQGRCARHGDILICDLLNLRAGQTLGVTLTLQTSQMGEFQTTASVLGLRRDDDLSDNERIVHINVDP